MKLANYYRTEENKFTRLISLNAEEDLTCYEKIYFFSEQARPPELPYQFKGKENLILGGTAFTNGIYEPFENEIIDYTLPKTFIYKEYLKQKYLEGTKTNTINHILDDTYYRQYAGEHKLPMPPVQRRKRVFIYDKKCFYDGWQETINELIDRGCSGIFYIHPIVCTTLTQFFNVCSIKKIVRSNLFLLNLNIPTDDINLMLNKYKKYFLAEIFNTSNIAIPLGGTFQTQFQYYQDLIYKLNLLYSFWCKGIPIKLYYIPPSVGVKNSIESLSIAIAKWSYNLGDKTINDKITRKHSQTEECIERDIVLKFHHYAKDLFKQSFEKLQQRGYWRI